MKLLELASQLLEVALLLVWLPRKYSWHMMDVIMFAVWWIFFWADSETFTVFLLFFSNETCLFFVEILLMAPSQWQMKICRGSPTEIVIIHSGHKHPGLGARPNLDTFFFMCFFLEGAFLGGGFKHFLFLSLFEEDSHVD